MFNIPSINVGRAANGIADIVDRFVETSEEKEAARLIRARLMENPQAAQIALTRIEARHSNPFISGWRPAVGWTCAAGFLWSFVLAPFCGWIAVANGWPEPPRPADTGELMTAFLSLCGLGAFRTIEKIKGVS